MAKRDSVAMLEAKIYALTKVRDMLKSGEQSFICYALANVVTANKQQEKAVDALKAYIEKSLGDNAFLTGWIRENIPKLYNETFEPKYRRKYRLQWIDWMLSCLAEDLLAKTTNTRNKVSRL